MTLPLPGQTVHMMTWPDIMCVLWNMRRTDGRAVRELALYTTDDLRHLYQATEGDMIRLREGHISRTQLFAVVRWRIFWERSRYGLLLVVSVLSAFFALFAWRDPLPPPGPPSSAAPPQPASAGK